MATSGTKLTEHEQQRIERLRQAGLSIREIAKEERVDPTTVHRILKTGVDKTNTTR